MNDERSQDDLDWLYRKQPEADHTRVFPKDDADRQAARSGPGRDGPPPRRQWAPPPDQQPWPTPPPQQQPWGPPPGHGWEEPPAPRRRRKRLRRRRRFGPRLLRNLFLLWLVFMIGTPIFAWVRGTVVDAEPSGDRPAAQPGTAVLLAGSDSRDGLSPEEQKELGTGSTEGARTDSVMILYKPRTGPSALISLPRDSLVDIPGHGQNKLNAAYAFGGPKLLVETVEQNTGIRLDGYLEVGFLGIVDVVDALGGIEVCLDDPIQDQDSHLDLPAGCQKIDGVTTLGYVRMRKADPRGDLGRMDRQREVIGKVARKAMNPIHFLNPVKYWRLNMAASNSLVRSKSVGIKEMYGAGSGFISSAAGSGMSLVVPIANPNAQTSVGSAMLWDEQASQEMFDAIKRGDMEALEKFEQ